MMSLPAAVVGLQPRVRARATQRLRLPRRSSLLARYPELLHRLAARDTLGSASPAERVSPAAVAAPRGKGGA